MYKTITVSKEIYSCLEKLADEFGDTPDKVIKRLLDDTSTANTKLNLLINLLIEKLANESGDTPDKAIERLLDDTGTTNIKSKPPIHSRNYAKYTFNSKPYLYKRNSLILAIIRQYIEERRLH